MLTGADVRGQEVGLRLAAPSRLLDVALWLWLLVVIGWTHALRFTAHFEWDSQLFLVMGKWLAQGIVPYRDAMEVKPPGIFLYLGGLFTVFGPNVWIIRFADLAWAIACAWALVRLLAREAGRTATAVAATAWVTWHNSYWFDRGGVYTEHYGAAAALIALACRSPIPSGLWLAIATLFKHPSAAVLVPIVIVRWQTWRARDWAWFVGAVAVPIGAVLLWLATAGAWDDFLWANLWILRQHGRFAEVGLDERVTPLLVSFWELTGIFPIMGVAVALGLIAALRTLSPLTVAAALWWVAAMAGVLLQGRYACHHYLLVLPAVALMGGAGLGWLIRQRQTDHLVVCVARAVAAAAVLWWGGGMVQSTVAERGFLLPQRWAVLSQGPGAWPQGPEPKFEETVGTYLRERTTPADRIHVQGYNPTLLFICWYADRAPAAPMFYELPSVFDRTRQLAQLVRGRPLYVVIDRAASIDPPMQEWLEHNYQVERTFGATYIVDLWRRRSVDPEIG